MNKCEHCGRGGLPVDNLWIALDLDGVVLESGHFPKLGPPVEGVHRALACLRDMGFKTMINTARTGLTDINGKYRDINKQVRDIESHLQKHDVRVDYVLPTLHKPSFVFGYIDDRAYRFTGDWDETIGDVQRSLTLMDVPLFGDKKKYLEKLII